MYCIYMHHCENISDYVPDGTLANYIEGLQDIVFPCVG